MQCWQALGIGAATAVLGNVLLLGLPGALWLALASPLAQRLGGTPARDLGDAAWPLAIVLTAVWGASLPLCWCVAECWQHWGTWATLALWAGSGFLAALLALAWHRWRS